jgi:hypothetical protein
MLVAATCYTNAQQTLPIPDIAAPVSKTDFAQKVKELDKFIGQDKLADADKKYTEIDPMIHAELKVMRYKIRDTHDAAQQKAYQEYTVKQRVMYGDILKLKSNMTGNRKALIDKLNEFADSIQ